MALTKKLTSLMVASGLVLSLVGTAAAASYTPGDAAGATRLATLGLVNGRPDTGLALDSTITRAEFVTIVDRAFGQDQNAKYLVGAPSFPDVTASHWASGYIAMAKHLIEAQGQSIGLPDGTFNPQGTLTGPEAVAFLMKFVGVQPDNSKAWPESYLSAAVNAGFVSADDIATVRALGNAPATRGLVFALADSAFHNYTLADGSTVYTKYVDTKAPTLAVDNKAVDATTDTAVKVTGKVAADAATLFVNGQQVTPAADGTFAADVQLALGDNTIAVVAQDVAGNKATQTLKVTRTTGTADAINAADITVAAGQSVAVNATVVDANGTEIANAPVAGTLSAASLGSFDGTTFTAGTVAGTGTLTLADGTATKTVNVTVTAGPLAQVVPSATSVAPGTKVTLKAQDQYGNVVAGAAFTQTSADALVDSTSGSFIASVAGSYTVTATANGVSKTATIGVYDATVASYSVAIADSNLVANDASTTTLTIKALDKNGNVVANTDAAGTVTPVVTGPALDYSTDGGTTWAGLGTKAIALTNGVATVSVRTSGANGIGGATSQVTVGAGSAAVSATVTLADQVAQKVAVTNDDTYLASNATDGSDKTVFTVQVQDQTGHAMKTGFFPVTVSLNSVDAAISAVNGTAADAGTTSTTVYYNGADQTVTVVPTVAAASGSVVLTATADGLTTGSDSVAMQWAGAASKLAVTAGSDNASAPVAGSSVLTYNVKATDAAGVTASTVPGNAKLVAHFSGLTSDTAAKIVVKDLNAVDPTAPVAINTTTFDAPLTLKADGTASFTVNTDTFTGNLAFQVKDNAGELAAAPAQTVNFAAGVANKLAVTVNGNAPAASYQVAANGGAVTIVAQLQDVKGNNTTNSDAELTLKATAVDGGATANDVTVNGTAATYTAKADATGKVTFTVNPGSFVGGEYSLALTGTYTDADGVAQKLVDADAIALYVVNSVASRVTYTLTAAGAPVSSVVANTAVTVKATVTDSANRPITDEVVNVYPVNSDGTLGTAIPTVSGNDGTYTATINPQNAPANNYKIVTSNGVNPASVSFAIGVKAQATPGGLKVAGGDQTVAANTEKAVTINLTDAYGNTVVNNTDAAISVKVITDNAAHVQIRSTSNGLALADNTVTIARGASSVTVYFITDADSATVISVKAETTFVGAPAATDSAAVNYTVK